MSHENEGDETALDDLLFLKAVSYERKDVQELFKRKRKSKRSQLLIRTSFTFKAVVARR